MSMEYIYINDVEMTSKQVDDLLRQSGYDPAMVRAHGRQYLIARIETIQLRADLASANERIAELETSQGWEPVTDGKIDDDITVTNNGRRIWLDDELGTYLAFTDDYCLMRRRPQEAQP